VIQQQAILFVTVYCLNIIETADHSGPSAWNGLCDLPRLLAGNVTPWEGVNGKSIVLAVAVESCEDRVGAVVGRVGKLLFGAHLPGSSGHLAGFFLGKHRQSFGDKFSGLWAVVVMKQLRTTAREGSAEYGGAV